MHVIELHVVYSANRFADKTIQCTCTSCHVAIEFEFIRHNAVKYRDTQPAVLVQPGQIRHGSCEWNIHEAFAIREFEGAATRKQVVHHSSNVCAHSAVNR